MKQNMKPRKQLRRPPGSPSIQGINNKDRLEVLTYYMNQLRGIAIKKCTKCKQYMLSDTKEPSDTHCTECIYVKEKL